MSLGAEWGGGDGVDLSIGYSQDLFDTLIRQVIHPVLRLQCSALRFALML